jgi:hypothetical protein
MRSESCMAIEFQCMESDSIPRTIERIMRKIAIVSTSRPREASNSSQITVTLEPGYFMYKETSLRVILTSEERHKRERRLR